LILDQIADQHLHLPWAGAAKWDQQTAPNTILNEGRKIVLKSGPAAEYMSKIAVGEAKNEFVQAISSVVPT
jgi:hypothetical protein